MECTFTHNAAEQGGGAIHAIDQSHPQLIGCTFVANESPWGAGIQLVNASYVALEATILAFNLDGEALYLSATSGCEIACTDIYGNQGGDWVESIAHLLGQDGNLSADPLFCDLPGDDLHLLDGSPCLPEFNPSCGLIGAWGAGCASAAIEPPGPSTVALELAVPNPFPRGASIELRLTGRRSDPAPELGIHDARGRLVRRLTPRIAADVCIARWDARDADGRRVPGGVYYCRAAVGAARLSQPLIILR
ncbi:MAG: hypothetical protein GF330_13485 [Candidatus Eisenbacteria bacterium]|nr:hypothetical protein [Candidatus Eisenbacteria bacterium]